MQLNYDAVKNDGQYHTMATVGEYTIKGYAGEFGNISLNVFASGKNLCSSYSLRHVENFIESFDLAGWLKKEATI